MVVFIDTALESRLTAWDDCSGTMMGKMRLYLRGRMSEKYSLVDQTAVGLLLPLRCRVD